MFTRVQADVTVREVTIKNPDRKFTGDVNDVMPGNTEDLEDLTKSSWLKFKLRTRESTFGAR